MPKPKCIREELFKSFEQIDYREVARELILFRGNEVEHGGVFYIPQLTMEAFTLYRLKADKTNFYNLVTRLHKQLRQNGRLLDCKHPELLPSKYRELCAVFDGVFYDRVELYEDFEDVKALNNSYAQKRAEKDNDSRKEIRRRAKRELFPG